MAWMMRPKLPASASFDGQMVYNSTDYEIDTTLRKYIESVDYEVFPQYIIKNTGFEKKKYKTSEPTTIKMSIMLVGNMPFYMQQILIKLAIAINSSGMIIEYRDSFVSGTPDVPVSYDCRWINAGDFVDTSELLFGGSIELVAYTLPEDEGRWYGGIPDGGVYEYVIDTPVSGAEWEFVVSDEDADEIFYEVP